MTILILIGVPSGNRVMLIVDCVRMLPLLRMLLTSLDVLPTIRGRVANLLVSVMNFMIPTTCMPLSFLVVVVIVVSVPRVYRCV